MEKLVIAVGTASEQKINYLKKVLKELNIKSKLIPVDLESGVSNQPTTSKETKLGSVNRAKMALKKVKSTDFSIGIEIGYHKNPKNKYEMFCWTTIADNYGNLLSAKSHRFLLPEYHQNILNKRLYLGDNLDGYFKKSKDSVKKNIDKIVRYRKPFIVNALKDVIVRYTKVAKILFENKKIKGRG